MNYRSNLAFGILVAVVVAVAVGVTLHLNDGEDDTTNAGKSPSDIAFPCQFESMGGEVRIVLSGDGATCATAHGVYATFRRMIQADEVENAYEPSPVANWTCQEYPFSEYPLLTRCRQGTRQFDVLGTAPSAHAGPEAYQ